MIFSSCRIRNQVPLLFCLALTSCISVGLINHFINKMVNASEAYGVSETSSADPKCLFRVAVWSENVCAKTFENLKWFPKFPSFPDEQQCAQNLSFFSSKGLLNTVVIKRLPLSLSSVEPGFYQLRARSSFALKIYLENNHQSRGRNLIMESDGSMNIAVFSKRFFVSKDSYFELITFSTPRDHFLALDWSVPGSAEFVPVRLRDLLPVIHVIPSQSSAAPVLPPDRNTLVGFIPRGHVAKGFHVCNSKDVEAWRNNQTSRNISVFTELGSVNEFIREVLKLIMASLQRVAPR